MNFWIYKYYVWLVGFFTGLGQEHEQRGELLVLCRAKIGFDWIKMTITDF